jgi:hypothetical protein
MLLNVVYFGLELLDGGFEGRDLFLVFKLDGFVIFRYHTCLSFILLGQLIDLFLLIILQLTLI